MLVLDTEDLPAADRTEAFHAVAVGESGSCSVEQEHPEAADPEETGSVELRPADPVCHARHWHAHLAHPTARAIRLDEHRLDHHPEPGDGRIHLERPSATRGPRHPGSGAQDRFYYEYAWSGAGLSVAFMVDTERLGLPEHLVRTAIPLLEHSNIAPLLLHHIRSLHHRADQLSADPAAEALASATLELTRALIVSVAADERTRRSVAEDTLLTRVLAYIRAHLTDPGLTPHSIAAAHNISVRTLYRLCEQGGLGLEKWIIRRRLEGTRRDLATPEHAHRTIEAIARSWGFTNAAYFSRRFHQTYGATPRQWRRLQHQAAFSPPDVP